MGVEIERTFRVDSDDWRDLADHTVRLEQGYFETAPEVTVRVRRVGRAAEGHPPDESLPRGRLTVKGRPDDGVRPEFEYTIPPTDVERMLTLFCGDRIVEKRRHTVRVGDDRWTVDEFVGRHEGLVLAEIELDSRDADFARPDWLGDEVTGDPAFTNEQLARR